MHRDRRPPLLHSVCVCKSRGRSMDSQSLVANGDGRSHFRHLHLHVAPKGLDFLDDSRKYHPMSRTPCHPLGLHTPVEIVRRRSQCATGYRAVHGRGATCRPKTPVDVQRLVPTTSCIHVGCLKINNILALELTDFVLQILRQPTCSSLTACKTRNA